MYPVYAIITESGDVAVRVQPEHAGTLTTIVP